MVKGCTRALIESMNYWLLRMKNKIWKVHASAMHAVIASVMTPKSSYHIDTICHKVIHVEALHQKKASP